MTPPNDPNRPEVLIVKQRPGRGPRGIVLPLLAVMVAGLGLIARSTCSNWRGFSQEFEARIGSWFHKSEKAPVLVARADSPKVEEKAPEPAKVEDKKAEAPKAEDKKVEAPKPDAKNAAEKAPEVAQKPKDEAVSPWEDIQKSAEKAKAEREETERLKAKAAEDLANGPPPPPPMRFGQPLNPAQIAEIQRLRAQAFRQMEEQMQARMNEHQRQFEEMVRRQGGMGRGFDEMIQRQAEAQRRMAQNFARMGQRGNWDRLDLNNLVPPPPPPGIDRDEPANKAGEPQVHEESGEEVRDGVKFKWTKRTIVIGGR